MGIPITPEPTEAPVTIITDLEEYQFRHGISVSICMEATGGSCGSEVASNAPPPSTPCGTALYWWGASSGLITGLTMDGNGWLHGTPSVAGTFNFTIKAECSDNAGVEYDEVELTITVEPQHTTTTQQPK